MIFIRIGHTWTRIAFANRLISRAFKQLLFSLGQFPSHSPLKTRFAILVDVIEYGHSARGLINLVARSNQWYAFHGSSERAALNKGVSMSLPNGFEEFVRLLRNSVDEMKQLGRAITAERGTEPTPYVGVETDDPITVSRRKLNVWLEQLEGYYGDHRDISDSPHIHLIAWIQSNVRSYFDSPEVDYCRVTIVDDREEYGELEFERLAYFHFEANLPFRFETPKFEGCVASFERYLSVCDSLLSNSEFVYFINSFGELTETDESEGGSRDIPSAKYALPKPGRNGGGKVTRNSLRKVILMFEQHRHSRGHRPTDQQIANHHNKHYPNQPRATAKIVSDARRRLRVKGILGWE